MRVLILGGAGFIGSNLARRCLQESGWSVRILDSLDPRLKSSKANIQDILERIEFIEGDIRDQDLLERLMPTTDIVFHAAAQTSHPYSLQDPLFDTEVNCIGSIKVLEAVKRQNPNAVCIYISTTTVIGRAQSEIIDEDHVERPTEMYSANKGVAEKYYQIYNRVFGLKSFALRIPNVFGPYGKPLPEFSFINFFISKVWANESIDIFGTGESVRNVMFVDDAVDLLICAALEPKLFGEILFATTHYHHSVREIAEKIIEVMGRGRLNLIAWPSDRKAIEVGNQRFSAERLFKIVSWRPRWSLEDGLLKTRKHLASREKLVSEVVR